MSEESCLKDENERLKNRVEELEANVSSLLHSLYFNIFTSYKHEYIEQFCYA